MLLRPHPCVMHGYFPKLRTPAGTNMAESHNHSQNVTAAGPLSRKISVSDGRCYRMRTIITNESRGAGARSLGGSHGCHGVTAQRYVHQINGNVLLSAPRRRPPAARGLLLAAVKFDTASSRLLWPWRWSRLAPPAKRKLFMHSHSGVRLAHSFACYTLLWLAG